MQELTQLRGHYVQHANCRQCLCQGRGRIESYWRKSASADYPAISITIINEGLLASLNVEAGGELARNLAGLYDYMTFCLIAANRTNNRKSVDDVIKLLAELREAWIVIDPQKTTGTNSVSTAATLPRQFVYS